MHRRLGSETLSQLAFSGEGNPNFSSEKSHWDNTLVKSVCVFVVFSEFKKKKKKFKYLKKSKITRARFLSDTAHCPIVMSKSVCRTTVSETSGSGP